MNLLNRFVKTDYTSYEDFNENFKINIPENFNFGFDIVDEMARLSPSQKALEWCNDKGESRTLTFKEISELSDKAANALTEIGIKKGDAVMLILKRRYHFWFIMVALHKIGAIAIPSTHLLTEHDIDYRIKSAEIKLIITVKDDIIKT
ncbi:MAG: putative acyl-CoA synthetase, partial [Clostridia bacterium]|nr:putative acyl-CoA synthetase [Clostridia bacterium]